MKNKKRNIKCFSILLFFLIFSISLLISLFYFLSPVSHSDKVVTFDIKSGESTSEIARNLEDAGLIKSDKFFMFYIYLTNHRNFYAARYDLSSGMRLSKIVDVLLKGGKNFDEISITFREELNVRGIAKVIAKNTNNSYNDVVSLTNDEKYINELIDKYWFIDKSVKNDKIYYSLEGFLYPDSYNFSSKDVSVKEIFESMLDNMDKHLKPYKDSFKKSKYSTFEIITIASMLELEGSDYSARRDIAGVFYNRLSSGMSLGSDVTTYYGSKKDMDEDLSEYELNSYNGYNTRAIGMEGKIPVGPICNPSIVSIKAALKPSSHDYYYFVADKNGKVYLTKTYETHNKVINELKNKGLWFEW